MKYFPLYLSTVKCDNLVGKNQCILILKEGRCFFNQLLLVIYFQIHSENIYTNMYSSIWVISGIDMIGGIKTLLSETFQLFGTYHDVVTMDSISDVSTLVVFGSICKSQQT